MNGRQYNDQHAGRQCSGLWTVSKLFQNRVWQRWRWWCSKYFLWTQSQWKDIWRIRDKSLLVFEIYSPERVNQCVMLLRIWQRFHYENKVLNNDGQQLHQHQQNEQSHLPSTHLMHYKTTIYDVGNPGLSTKYGELNRLTRSQPSSFSNWIFNAIYMIFF